MISNLNLFSIVIALFLLIIVINILGGSVFFYDSINNIQNKDVPKNVEAFVSDESVYNIINKITKNVNLINNANKINKNENVEKFSINPVSKSKESFQNMNEFEPMNAKKNDSNIQSNLINICNKTQNDFHSLLEDSP